MTWPDAIANALRLNRGARFYRVALQVNPHGYAEKYRGQKSSLPEEEYASALADKAAALGIEALAITDHNHCGSVAAVAEACSAKGVTVFPGFEASSQEGVHYLCLFDPKTPEETLNRILGLLGITDTSPNTELAKLSCTDLTRTVYEAGGVVVAAHSTNPKGLLVQLTGAACVRAWRDEHLIAAQIPGAVNDLPTKYKRIFQNKNAEYRREQPAGDGLALASVNALDVVRPEDLDEPAATCWIKMTEPTIEGLRQAFLDPGSRVRLNSDPEPEPHARLVAIAWQGGFLDGQAIHFSENMNVLIGGRGTGKSTVLESVRQVLGLKPIGPLAQAAHSEIVKGVIGHGTEISLLVHSPHPSPKHYLVQRTPPNPPRVF